MSIKVMSRVWDHAEATEGALLVLLALADYADDDGICWPAVDSIAKKARLKPRQTYNVLRALIERGDIAVESGGHGRGQRNRYVVLVGLSDTERVRVQKLLCKNNSVTEPLRVQSDDVKGAIDDTFRVQSAQTKKSPNSAPASPKVEQDQDDNRHREPSKKEPSREKAAPAPVKPKQEAHPAIKAYSELTGVRNPNQVQREQIVETVGSDLEGWRSTLTDWLGRGYNPRNVTGMLDAYGKTRRPASSDPVYQNASLPRRFMVAFEFNQRRTAVDIWGNVTPEIRQHLDAAGPDIDEWKRIYRNRAALAGTLPAASAA